MTDIVKSIGVGKDYADLNAFFAAAPSNLVTVSERWIAQIYGHLTFSASQVLSGTRTTSASFNFIIEAAPNEGLFNPDFIGSALYFDPTKGGAITSTVSGVPAIKIDGAAYTVIRGLQIKASNTAAQQILYTIGSNLEVRRNIFERNATDTGVALLFQSGSNLKFEDNVLLSTGTGSAGMSTDYSASVTVTGNTFYAVNGSTNVGMFAQSGMNPLMRNNIIIGFTPPLNGASSSSSNNATNAASMTGTSNILNLVASNVFTSTTDLRLKAGSSLIGAGVTVSGKTTDIFGYTLSSPPSIGASEVQTPTTTINCSIANAVSNGSTATIYSALIIGCFIGTAIAAGPPVSIGNNVFASSAAAIAQGSAANIISSQMVSCLKGNAAATGSLSTAANYLTTDVIINNSGIVQIGMSTNYSWYPNGRIGSLSGITPVESAGDTNASGKLVTSITHTTPGILLVSKRNSTFMDDDVYLEAFA